MIEQLAAPAMATAAQSVADRLADAGASIVEIDLSGLAALNARASIPIALFEVRREWLAFLNETLKIGLEDFVQTLASPDVRRLFGAIVDRPLPDQAYAEAVGAARHAMRQLYGRCFAQYGIAAILRPTTPVTAVPIATSDFARIGDEDLDIFVAMTRFVDPSSVAGLPSVTIPAGLLDGLPFGVDLDGPIGSDGATLALADAAQTAIGRIARPSL
jgi:mandelamide amidase